MASQQKLDRPVMTPTQSRRATPSQTPQQTAGPSQSLSRAPHSVRNLQPVPRPAVAPTPPWMKEPVLKVKIQKFPPNFGTLEIYRFLKAYGNLVRIDLSLRQHDRTDAYVFFSPPPMRADWMRDAKERAKTFGSYPLGLDISIENYKITQHQSPVDPMRKYPEELKATALKLDFGVMETEDSMLLLQEVLPAVSAPIELTLNMKWKVLDIQFAISHGQQPVNHASSYPSRRLYKMRLNIPQLSKIYEMEDSTTGEEAWIVSVEMPPMMYRRTNNVEDTHETSATLWNDWQTWYRQTEITSSVGAASKTLSTQLQKTTAFIDIGRWLTYRLVFPKSVVSTNEFKELRQALKDHNVAITNTKPLKLAAGQSKEMWNWLDNPRRVLDNEVPSTSLSELHELAHETIHLPFQIRYQLEACISHGFLHECNITGAFLQRLADMDHTRATKLLEKVMDEGKRFYQPDDIFREVLPKVRSVPKATPSYCANIRTATVTPTTMYFNSAAVEPSNRIVRLFRQYEDRFLRVKFLDEKYKGKLISSDGAAMNEVFTRAKRTLVNGIKVGNRHYEFLAFGNSQLRECGAWFFASTSTLTAQDIRNRMGDFDHIRIVAKYCSRIGQCFSTTRAMQIGVNVERIPDIERNGFCFSDGVGKISPFLAQWIAQEHGLPSSTTDFPSVFQFRLGGCKGVLAVDPSLNKNTVQIRPSQEKFSAIQHRGLEICRVSQYSAAYLNIQIILILSALGIEDNVFVSKMRHQLADIKEAMVNPEKAMELLQKTVDYNHMTIQLAQMILCGFMATEEPFMRTCLRLWRSWSIQYLKEKARIFIDDGAFVLGCVDETGTLKGHFNHESTIEGDAHDIASLPEIFLQIPNSQSKGKWRVIQGVCLLARNPSLHPGDVRVVLAVDRPTLHHYKNCVVFPQTGDRDLANMCSGGDLDGDDYLVMWDTDLMPPEWNHPPMDYTPPTPLRSKGPVTLDDMTSFFVTHMKHDNVALIATAHRYWADVKPDGVKDPICLELAQLHSTAVDYAKTGVPAVFNNRLKAKSKPHWAFPKSKPKGSWHISNKVLGKLFNAVKTESFEPAWDLPFDERILTAYDLDEEQLEAARDVKNQYDEAIRRLMSKYSIKSEFEVWTTFVLEHSDDIGDYKIAEMIGEAVGALKGQYQKLCCEKAGTPNGTRDRQKLLPFVAAMYAVTAQEMAQAVAECKRMKVIGGRWLPAKVPSTENMPFMSFPWLFPDELGIVACSRGGVPDAEYTTLLAPKPKLAKKPHVGPLSYNAELEPLEEVNLSEFPANVDDAPGRPTNIDIGKVSVPPHNELSEATFPDTEIPLSLSNLALDTNATDEHDADTIVSGGDLPTSYEMPVVQINGDRHYRSLTNVASPEPAPVDVAAEGEEDEDEVVGEEVTLEIDSKPLALDALEKLLES